MGTMLRALALCLLLILNPRVSSAQTYTPVTDSDFVIAGIGPSADTAEVLRVFGTPSDRSLGWQYDGIVVAIDGSKVHWIWVTSAKYPTRRGLRVGDSLARVTQLYGQPCQPAFGRFFVFCGPGDRRGLLITVTDGKVIDMRLGVDLLNAH